MFRKPFVPAPSSKVTAHENKILDPTKGRCGAENFQHYGACFEFPTDYE